VYLRCLVPHPSQVRHQSSAYRPFPVRRQLHASHPNQPRPRSIARRQRQAFPRFPAHRPCRPHLPTRVRRQSTGPHPFQPRHQLPAYRRIQPIGTQIERRAPPPGGTNGMCDVSWVVLLDSTSRVLRRGSWSDKGACIPLIGQGAYALSVGNARSANPTRRDWL